jgi:hypothetical protein
VKLESLAYFGDYTATSLRDCGYGPYFAAVGFLFLFLLLLTNCASTLVRSHMSAFLSSLHDHQIYEQAEGEGKLYLGQHSY